MLSLDAHNPPKAEHLRDHDISLPATPTLPAHSQRRALHRTLFHHRDKNRFQLHAFVVMPDHIHVLITPATNESTAKCIQYLKGGYSFAARKQGEIWHSGYHEHRIRDANDFISQSRYIANNPARKQLADHAYVHTRFLDRLDPMHAHLSFVTNTPATI